jgi:hypothetical protein
MMNKFNDPEGNEYRLVVGRLKYFAEFASSAKIETTEERDHHQDQTAFSDFEHCLFDMPDLCHPYQPQPAIHDSLTNFSILNDGGPNKLVLSGLPGRGKTQSCVAFMQAKEKQNIEGRGYVTDSCYWSL